MKRHLLSLLAIAFGTLVGSSAFAADTSTEGGAYPLKVCVVSGEKLGSMGKSYVHNHEGREVQFCCKGCLKDFNKDPQKYLKKLDAAVEKQKN